MTERDIHEEETIELQLSPAEREALELMAQEAAKRAQANAIPSAYTRGAETS